MSNIEIKTRLNSEASDKERLQVACSLIRQLNEQKHDLEKKYLHALKLYESYKAYYPLGFECSNCKVWEPANKNRFRKRKTRDMCQCDTGLIYYCEECLKGETQILYRCQRCKFTYCSICHVPEKLCSAETCNQVILCSACNHNYKTRYRVSSCGRCPKNSIWIYENYESMPNEISPVSDDSDE